MDIHRSRFVPYPPAAITCLAFSHVSGTNKDFGNDVRLAIGRANGEIEIWNPLRGDWVQEIILHGGRGRTVDGLVWTQEPDESVDGKILEGRLRLFSVGYSTSITEWDLQSGLPMREASGGGSAIWCLSAQSKLSKPVDEDENGQEDRKSVLGGQDLVAGCADGSLILFSTTDSDLRFQRYITRAPTKKAQALSITFQDRHKVVAGYANSTIRVHDIRNGKLIRNITLGAGLPGGPKETLVWQVKCLPGGDIVSGSSNGEIQVWDGKSYSQRQRIAGHKSDILALTVSSDGKTIFSGGTDTRTVIYKQDNQKRWSRVYNEKIHKHEIKALAAFQDRKIDVVASGGIDASPIMMPIRQFGNEYSRHLPRLPQQPPLVSAPSQRLLATWWNRDVLIWRIGRSKSQNKMAKNWNLVSHLVMKSEENISSVSLSDDGQLLAVSTVSTVKLFHLHTQTDGKHTTRVRKIEVPRGLSKGARLVQISLDKKWLVVVGNTSDVAMGRITSKASDSDEAVAILPETVPLRRTSKAHPTHDGLNGTWGNYNRAITRLAFSGDSRMLVVSDLGGSLDSWILKDDENPTLAPTDKVIPNGASHSTSSPESNSSDSDSDDEDEDTSPVSIFGQHWVCNHNNFLLPTLDSMPLILSFRPFGQLQRALADGRPTESSPMHSSQAATNQEPGGDYRLLIVTAKHQIYEFDVLNGQLTDWSRRNPTSSFPARWRGIMDRAMGCVWDVSYNPPRDRLWMYGSRWLVMFDLSQNFPLPQDTDATNGESRALVATGNDDNKGKKRKRNSEQVLRERKQLSGAGGKVMDTDRENVGFGRKIRTVVGTGKDAARESQPIVTESRNVEEQDEDSSMDEEDNVVLPVRDLGHSETVADGARPSGEQAIARHKHGPPWWITFQYRSILGVVPIDGKEDGQPSEVVLVERPLWDLDLPPRFSGPHDRD